MSRRDDAVDAVLAVVRTSYETEIQHPAATLAYYGFVSLIPLLVILLAVVGDPIAGRVRSATLRFLPAEAQRLVTQALADSSGRLGATLFAIAVLAWSAANIAAGFLTVIDRVEGPSERSLSGRLRGATGVLGSLGVGIAAVVVASAGFALSPRASAVMAGGFLVLFVSLTVAFLPLYYLPSSAVTSLTAGLPGALVAAFGWTVLIAAIRFYAENAATYAVYGVLSGIILVLTSLYVAAALLMIGVVVNATLSGEATSSEPFRQ